MHSVHALGLRDGIAFPQLIVVGRRLGARRRGRSAHPGRPDGRPRSPRRRRRPRRGRAAPGARGRDPGRARAAAFQAAARDPVPDRPAGPAADGKVLAVGPLDPVLAAPGVVQADTYLQVGETIRPVRLDGDRRGYVIATADTSVEALQRAEEAARLPGGRGRVDAGRSWRRRGHEHLEAPSRDGATTRSSISPSTTAMSPGWFRPCSTIQRTRSSLPLKVNSDLTGRIHSTGERRQSPTSIA